MTLLQIRAVTKSFGEFKALDDFSGTIQNGVTGLLGPNGAGKTTFIRGLLGLLPFDQGSIDFLEEYTLPRDIKRARDQMGYQPEVVTKIANTTAMRYVTHMGILSGLPRSAAKQRAFDTLHYVGLEEARYRDMNTFSQGMMQKVKLATALIHDPALLLLDEPTSGCDPASHEQILNLIRDLGHNHGKNILISTHLLGDIEKCASQVLVMSQGKTIASGSLEQILAQQQATRTVQVRVSGEHEQFTKILRMHGIEVLETTDSMISCILPDELDHREIFKMARNSGMDVRMLSSTRQTLEEVFLDLVKTNGGVVHGD